MRKSLLLSLIIFLVIFAYSVVRYNIFKGIPWAEVPLFISNKALSFSAVVFIAFSYKLGTLARFLPRIFSPLLSARKFFGLLGFSLAALHSFISLIIFKPVYYPKLFLTSGRLNTAGELSILFGVLAFFVFAVIAVVSITAIAKSMEFKRWLAIQRLGYVGLILVLFHVSIIGFEGWLKPASWPAGLLPISLLAAIAILVTLILKIFAIIFPRE